MNKTMKKPPTVQRLILCTLLFVTSTLFTTPPALAQPSDELPLYLPQMLKETEGVTTIQQIEQARETGKISDEQALIYKVQAVVGDPALPSEYLGYDPHQDGTLVMTEAVTSFDSLSPATQAILAPYLRAPSEPDSWIALNELAPPTLAGHATPSSSTALTWETINAVGNNMKIWYHPEYAGDGARAQKVAAELERHIWPKLTGAFGFPLTDCGAGCPSGGGDFRIDIYIAHIDRSYVEPYEVRTDGMPTFMVLEPDVSFAIVAHELMHMIQFSYPLSSFAEYDWTFESVAQWAMDFVYPTDNLDPDFPRRHEEQLITSYYLGDPNVSLEFINDKHEYGSYLYWFYLRSPAVVKSVIQNMDQPSSLETVNTATPGNFQTAWPNFALYNWNQTPIEYYQQWDELKDSPGATNVTYFGEGEDTFDIKVNHLAARYYHFYVDDDSIKRVRVDLPLALQEDANAHVWAILKIDGLWRTPENWTEVTEKVWCRDNAGENVEEIVLIISNNDWQDTSHVLEPGDGKLTTYSDCGCQEANAFQEWTGTATMSYTKMAAGEDTTAETNRQAELNFHLTREPDTAFGNYRWQGNPVVPSSASVSDELVSGGNTFTWVGSEITPNTNRIRLEINPATCQYEIWVGVFIEATYTHSSGEQEEQQHIEYRVYEVPIPEEATDFVLTGNRTVPVQIGGGDEGIDRLFTGPGAMGQIDLLLDGELGNAPISWSFTPVEPEEE